MIETMNDMENKVETPDTEENNDKRKPRTRRQSFEVDDRITVRLDPDLAEELAELILQHKSDDKAFFALGKMLENAV